VPAARDWTSDLTLLCEQCGYVIEGLPTDGACPECGRSIASSLPSARPGSPWQQRPSVGTWCLTTLRILLTPGRVFGVLDVSPRASRGFLAICLVLGAAVISLLPALRLVDARHPLVAWSPASGNLYTNRFVIAPLLFVVGTLGVGALLAALTWIEFLGIRFFHGRRGWRITRGVAWNICAHAAAGWFLGCVLAALAWALIDLDFLLIGAGRPSSLRSRIGDWAALPPVAGFFLGMLLFEVRVYQGVRACRFANRRPA
jgi:hypothetical protein